MGLSGFGFRAVGLLGLRVFSALGFGVGIAPRILGRTKHQRSKSRDGSLGFERVANVPLVVAVRAAG